MLSRNNNYKTTIKQKRRWTKCFIWTWSTASLYRHVHVSNSDSLHETAPKAYQQLILFSLIWWRGEWRRHIRFEFQSKIDTQHEKRSLLRKRLLDSGRLEAKGWKQWQESAMKSYMKLKPIEWHWNRIVFRVSLENNLKQIVSTKQNSIFRHHTPHNAQ